MLKFEFAIRLKIPISILSPNHWQLTSHHLIGM